MTNQTWTVTLRLATALGLTWLCAAGCEAISGVNDLEVVATGGTGDGSVGQGGTSSGGAQGTAGDTSGGSGGTGGSGGGSGGTGGSAGATGCTDPGDCPGEDNECATRACTNSQCGFNYTPDGTAVAAQTTGDCKRNECDGAGTLAEVADPDDPYDDANACTQNVCGPTGPNNPPEPANTPCGTTTQCDGAGNCVGCTSNSQCAADTECSDWSCETTTGTCVSAPRSTTTTCGTAPSCSGGVETLQDLCDGAGACADAGTRSCSPFTCGSDACRATCTSDTHCVSDHYCGGLSGSACVPKEGLGATCTAANECASGFCVDGVCCDTACTGLCNTCNGVSASSARGTCGSIADGTDPGDECAGGRVCTATNTCTGVIACACGTPTYSASEACCGACDSNECPPEVSECNAQDGLSCTNIGNATTYRIGGGVPDESGQCATGEQRCAVGTCTCRP
jgi:hypothetical protein